MKEKEMDEIVLDLVDMFDEEENKDGEQHGKDDNSREEKDDKKEKEEKEGAEEKEKGGLFINLA
eukprot:15366925-Ditylum_brightwellii.AAC.1